ncbi:MAG TPA: AI-2E family transporter [Longimicrobiales bacterium]|nr:AI-2E family transporter [Longimicrobiales bacterium]
MPRYPERVEWKHLYAAATLLVAALYLFSVRSIFSPFVAFLLLLVLLLPYAGSTGYVGLVLGFTVLTLLWLLTTVGSILAPFVLALALAYILDPAVDWLQRRRLPRWAAILVLALPVVALVLLAVLVGIPALIDEVELLVSKIPDAVAGLAAWIERARVSAMRWNVPFVGARLQAWLQTLTPERIGEMIAGRQAEIGARLWDAVVGVGRGLGFAFTILGYVVLTPVLTFYLLRDYDRITSRLGTLVPVNRRESWIPAIRQYDQLLSRFLRGQLIEAALVGIMTWIGLRIVGFPNAALVATIAAVFNVVPYLGLPVSLIPVIVIALVSGNVLSLLLRAGIVFAIVQFIDGSVTGPRIAGGSVGLHPVWIMLALTIGGAMFGFVGLLLAVPLAILVKLLLLAGLVRYRRSRLYLGPAAAGEPEA